MTNIENRLEKIVQEARRLRHARETADATFLLYLLGVEREHIDLIIECGYESFEQFLKGLELVDPARYASFRRGVGIVGEEAALEIGAEAVIVASKTRDETKVSAYVEATRAWSGERGGVLPTRQTSNRILRQVDPRQEVPRDLGKQHRIRELEAECQALRAELRKAKAMIRKLEKQVASRAA